MATRSIFRGLILAQLALHLCGQTAKSQQAAQPPAEQAQAAAQMKQQQPLAQRPQQLTHAAPSDEAERARLLKQRDALSATSKELYGEGKFDQALDTAQKMLALERQIFGPDSDDAAGSFSRIGAINEAMKDWAAARQARQDGIAMLARLHGPNSWKVKNAQLKLDHTSLLQKLTVDQQQQLDSANELQTQGSKLIDQGKYRDAIPLAAEAVKLCEAVLGPDHPDVAANLNTSALSYSMQGNYVEALPLYERSLKIYEKAFGPDHPDVAIALNNLASLYYDQGNYAKALPLIQKALKIDEKAYGPDHPEVAFNLNELANLYRAQGNYAEALPLYQRALKIREKVLRPDDRYLAISLDNLAFLYKEQGNYAEAMLLSQQALKIFEKVLGPEHPFVATNLNNLGGIYQAQGNYAEALPLVQRALKIREKALGPDNPDIASDLNNLAFLYKKQGNYAEALPLYQRSLRIRQTALGADHPKVATVLNNLAELYFAQGNYAEALPLFERATWITGRNLELTAAVQSERQQLENIKTSRFYLDSFVSCALLAGDQPAATISHQLSPGGRGSEVYAQMLAWKGAVTLRQRLERAARHSDEPDEQKLWNDFQIVATQLANASRTTPSPQQHEDWQQTLADLTKQKEQLEADLSQRSAEFRKLRSQTKLTPDMLAKNLPSDTALVDLLQFSRQIYKKQTDSTIKAQSEQRLAAFVVRPDQPVAIIDLGLVDPINEAVGQWRKSYGGYSANRKPEGQPGMKLRWLVWKPLAQHLDGIKTVLVSPDGDVAKFPWCALPGSKPDSYLIEDGIAIAFIPVPQMLVDLLNQKKIDADQEAPTLLVLGDVNYDAAPDDPQPSSSQLASHQPSLETPPQPPDQKNQVAMAEPPHRAAIRGPQWMEFPTLPGTAKEVAQIEALYQARFTTGKPLELKQSEATQQRLREEAPKYRYLHLATHGFFAPPEIRSALVQDQQSSQALQMGQEQQVVGFNPGLLSGLALAGANRGNHPESSTDSTAPPADDGIMTALEVASLDLQNVDLVTLSACETGLGQATGGEGMLGLQRAFQVAGARTTVSSLWSVDDAATQTMMSEFYTRLWDKEHPLGKLEALRQAQLEMLHHYDPRTKKLVDRGRGLELDTEPSDNNGRLSPKYWAAFELSGDWR